MNTYSIFICCLSTSIAFGANLLLLPMIIRVSIQKGWFDEPGGRKVHTNPIPRTGGIVLIPAMIGGIAIAYLSIGLWPPIGVLAGILLLYLGGAIDDLKGLSAYKKLALQIAAGLLLAADGWRISQLGPGPEFPLLLQYLLTVLSLVVIVNAYNLIDGIDGLAAGLGVLSGTVFIYLFYRAGDLQGFLISAGMTGTYAAFLFFNFSPAKIFMGDTGSMCLGFLLAILSIRLLDQSLAQNIAFSPWQCFAILSTPLYDILRVVIDRVRRKIRIFHAEKNHVHHLVLESGFSHRMAMLLILLANGISVWLALFRPDIEWYFALPAMSLLFLLAIAIFRNLAWYRIRREVSSLLTRSEDFKSENPFFENTFLIDSQ